MTPSKAITENTLFYGDNLPILRDYIPDESIDLVYLDPPFNSNRTYNVLFRNESGEESEAQMEAFDDTWHWDQSTAALYDELLFEGPNRVGTMIESLYDFIGPNQMMAYLVMMTARLVELQRVLKPVGTLYLHCDPTSSHYLKVIVDTIFGPENFLNEVVWQRTAVKGDVRRKFGAVHDILLVYTNGKRHYFQSLYKEPDEEYAKRFRFDDNDERGPYQSAPLDSPNPRPNLTYPYEGYQPPEKGWRVSREVMEQLDSDGRLIFPKNPSGRIRRKVYLEEVKGPKVTDVWTDIPPLQASSSERLGYPTQKPLDLLERIIESSSQPGEIILDPFCGCGTAVAAAQKLGRRWIGIDITHLAISLIRYRMKDMFPDIDFETTGEPESEAAARYLANEDRFQFEGWAVSLVDARPREKKGADKGIDGIIRFKDEAKKHKRIIVQVKSGKVGVSQIRDLVGTVQREKAVLGIFITLEEPTKPMIAEAASAGFYHSPGWGQKYPKIQILTIEELLDGAEVKMPPRGQTFKTSQRVKEQGPEQKSLFE